MYIKGKIKLHLRKPKSNDVFLLLRTVPPFATAHTFCASRDCQLLQRYFARVMTMWEKQILARAIGMEKRNEQINYIFFSCRTVFEQLVCARHGAFPSRGSEGRMSTTGND